MKRSMTLLLAVGIAVVLIVGTALVEGRWTDRWQSQTSDELRSLASAMSAVPLSVGDWDGEDRKEANQDQLKAAGAVGHLSRTYRNPKSGDVVSIYMICGASRDIAIHTPDACYPGAGFHLEGDPTKVVFQYSSDPNLADKPEAATRSAEFMTAVFMKEEPAGVQRLRIFWAWNATGNWEAPDWPRLRFGGRAALSKLYLICPEPIATPTEESTALQFAKVFLPAADRQLGLLAPASSAAPVAGNVGGHSE
jgi:hypothetical protein